MDANYIVSIFLVLTTKHIYPPVSQFKGLDSVITKRGTVETRRATTLTIDQKLSAFFAYCFASISHFTDWQLGNIKIKMCQEHFVQVFTCRLPSLATVTNTTVKKYMSER